ncbi:MAG: hypothetical protein GX774_04035 [Armatimonadetes bacterium]|jgi:hypothetical protein|nr:hypothetical protein [Armatimonadota bacterium]
MMPKHSVELLFHPVPAQAGRESKVFADAAKRLLDETPNSEIRLVSPYLGLEVLGPLVWERRFRLLTDLLACFEGGADPQCVQFLREHADHVRHLAGVHAKVILTDGGLLFGSANLTRSGFMERDELGCLIRDPALIQPVSDWFNALWAIGEPIDDQQLTAAAERGARLAEARRRAGTGAKRPARASTTHRGRRTLGWMTHWRRRKSSTAAAAASPVPANEETDREELVQQLRLLTQSRRECDQVLALLARALQTSGLTLEDSHLHVNFGKSPQGDWNTISDWRAINVTIGQRYVAWCTWEKGAPEFGFILDDEAVARRAAQTLPGAWNDTFTKRRMADSPTLHVRLPSLEALPEEVLSSWERAIRQEAARRNADGSIPKSSFRKYLRPFLYHVLTNPDLCQEISAQVHPPRS